MARRRYTDEERANAIAALAANNDNIEKTSAQIGIPEQTLRHWKKGTRHPEATQMGAIKKGEMAAALQDIAWELIELMPKAAKKAAAMGRLSQLATSMGISIDKRQLLLGLPTNITHDVTKLSDDELAAEREALERALRCGDARDSSASATEPAIAPEPDRMGDDPSSPPPNHL